MKHVAYYRVSTALQGRSGLGLEGQKRAVAEYLNGGDWKIVGEFTEVESGKRADRPELAKALAMCRLHGARLVIAKLDRLSRNAHFLLGLKESGVDFVAADMPNANRLTVGIMLVDLLALFLVVRIDSVRQARKNPVPGGRRLEALFEYPR